MRFKLFIWEFFGKFAGFAAEYLASRIIDGKCVLLISANGCYRGEKLIKLKNITDCALNICFQRFILKFSKCKITQFIQVVINIWIILSKKHLIENSNKQDDINHFAWNVKFDICWDQFIENKSDLCEPLWIDGQDPIFTLYTRLNTNSTVILANNSFRIDWSGSTGKPKGIVHSIGYILCGYYFAKKIFKMGPGVVSFLTSDIGWSLSHFHTIYGTLANGATNVLMEGLPNFPSPDRLWEIIDRLNVNIFYTVPTVLRMSMEIGDNQLKEYNRSSLRILALAGEVISPEVYTWLWMVLGDSKCLTLNLYGQTETVGFSRSIYHIIPVLSW